MKVYVVVGAKKNGNTDKLVSQFVHGALSAGHTVDVDNLFVKKNLHGCIDCQACKRSSGVCLWKDDMPEMIEKLLAADVLVFASPVYFFSISSQLKLFMDRTYAVMEKIQNKRFYFIATAEGPSDTYAKDFKRVVEPVQGWLDCFEGMKFEKMICSFDTGTTAVEQTEVWLEAEEAGAQI